MSAQNASSYLRMLTVALLALTAWNCTPGEKKVSGPPDENRFTTVVLTKPGELDEPMEIAFLGNNKAVFVERKGNVKTVDLASGEVKKVGFINVNTKYTSAEGRVTEAEEGLLGVVAHPDYDKNHWIYMLYADPAEPKHVLARWELVGDSLIEATRKVVLEYPTQRETCCHTGGGMVFDKEGNLYITTGNNTGNPIAGTSGLDERPGRSSWDDQRTAGNTNDLRGKILRIHPEADGTYTIPEGNLFPPGTEKTRPEIYTMGHRNPWRVSVDSKTGFIYWGEVGPDASRDSTIGPRGYDELNQAKAAGFFGWPYFIGDNIPYPDFDYATNQIGALADSLHPKNPSPNNTGLTDLPTPQNAFIWYPYANSPEFPLVGSSGRSATGGPVFRKADFANAKRPFPDYYEGKWLAVDFMRGWIMSITMDENGDYQSMEKFLPKETFSSAIDMKFSPDGDLYVLEYGSAWFRGNDNAQIKRIEYNGGNRVPMARAKADKTAGALPLTVQFSADGTTDYDDYDQGKLNYQWVATASGGYKQTWSTANPTVTFDKPGEYDVTLTVTDTKGEKSSESLKIHAGNEAPTVVLSLTKGNKSFFFAGSTVEYDITVTDREDGSLADGKIKSDEVSVNFDYAPEGFDPIEVAANRTATDEWVTFSKGAHLISKSDCRSCHMNDKNSVGPAYIEVAKKYKNDKGAWEKLADKIIAGGGGVWGDHAMSAHPQISKENALTMVDYIMGLANTPTAKVTLPMKGTFVTKVPAGDNGRGSYVLRVAYTDKGTQQLSPLASETILPLRNPVFDAEKADIIEGSSLMTTPMRAFYMTGDGARLGYRNLDLTDIKQISFLLQAQPRSGAIGGWIEVHLDKPDGKLIGKTDMIVAKDVDFRKIMAEVNKRNAGKNAGPIDFGAMRKLMSTNAGATIEPQTGAHDIYFVFRNPEAKPSQILVQMMEIEFKNK
ncbi:MAG: PQQ-dependent sugar dehydrogenase [Cyclobacteriaceae bacterium]|nr:PQQ-dependent sugar dehydrogenase [Cyclobacteriaceae bacterium]